MIRLNRRQAAGALLGSFLTPLSAPSIVRAASDKPIFIVVPYAGGGTTDNMLRTIAKGMSEMLKQPVLVDNKPGGNGIVGSQYVARAAKDGLTLLAGGTGPISLNAMLRKNLPYKVADFTSVALLATGPLTLTVNSQMPANDVKSFVAYAKSRDKPLFYGTLGPGSVTHLYGLIMSRSMAFPVTDVAYRNNPASILELLSGECDLSFATPSAVIEHVKAGKLKMFALSTEKRHPDLPEIPTFAESGYPELNASYWTALHAPAGTPPDMVARLNEAANFALKTPEIAKLMEIEFQSVQTGPPSLLDDQLAKDIALWGPVIKAHNIVID